ncbi:MAG TPA: DUF134 domain-containing protein [Candidatus Aenigmarchaeota archaeon]|nr:DUF134 domain-containing protein [Candidatus Aenigmarchaeota archaeon]
MVRPKKYRFVSAFPKILYFKPHGMLSELEEIELYVEELEAIKLKDLDGLKQEECAKKMKISRPTFHRIYRRARKKIAEALINGKALKIERAAMVNKRVFECLICYYRWDQRGGSCPKCGSKKIRSNFMVR